MIYALCDFKACPFAELLTNPTAIHEEPSGGTDSKVQIFEDSEISIKANRIDIFGDEEFRQPGGAGAGGYQVPNVV